MHNTFRNFLLTFLLIGSLAACAAISGQETVGEYIDDTTITTKVKTAIINDPSLKSFQIKVETLQGEVQLSGFVNSLRESAKAERYASRTKGVKSVKNDLVVKKQNK